MSPSSTTPSLEDAALSFAPFSLSSQMMGYINQKGFTKPSPIQAQVIPHILNGRDIIGLAQTGTGKTAAYVIPLLEKLVFADITKEPKKGTLLILVPTRELAEQVREEVMSFSKGTSLTSACIYGGVRYESQIKNLKKGVSVLIACPGRLLDHLQRKTLTLSTVTTLVLDEADQMFDMGFYPAVQQIVKKVPKQRQTLMFSATMPPEIQELAGTILSEPVLIELARRAPAQSVNHRMMEVKSSDKPASLLALLTQRYPTQAVLIFTKMKHTTKKLHTYLEEAGVQVTSLQGNLSQGQRARSMKGFRDGSFNVMVATDIAARGIDVSSIECVINYELPATVETYIHRIGRTGRAERKGEALSLVAREERFLLRRIEKGIGVAVVLDKTPLDLKAAHQKLSEIAAAERNGSNSSSSSSAGSRDGRRERGSSSSYGGREGNDRNRSSSDSDRPRFGRGGGRDERSSSRESYPSSFSERSGSSYGERSQRGERDAEPRRNEEFTPSHYAESSRPPRRDSGERSFEGRSSDRGSFAKPSYDQRPSERRSYGGPRHEDNAFPRRERSSRPEMFPRDSPSGSSEPRERSSFPRDDSSFGNRSSSSSERSFRPSSRSQGDDSRRSASPFKKERGDGARGPKRPFSKSPGRSSSPRGRR